MKLIGFSKSFSLVRLHDESWNNGKSSLSIYRGDMRLIQSVLLVNYESEGVRQPTKLLQFRHLFRRFRDDSQYESDFSPLFIAYRRFAGTHPFNLSFQRKSSHLLNGLNGRKFICHYTSMGGGIGDEAFEVARSFHDKEIRCFPFALSALPLIASPGLAHQNSSQQMPTYINS